MRNYKLLTLILVLFFSSCGVKKVSYRDKNPKKIKNKSVKAVNRFFNSMSNEERTHWYVNTYSKIAINEMNKYNFLPKRMQFHYFINSIRKKKRFGGKWLSQKKVKDLEVIKEYYGYSNQKAKEALNLLSDDQIENIKLGLKKGGRKK